MKQQGYIFILVAVLIVAAVVIYPYTSSAGQFTKGSFSLGTKPVTEPMKAPPGPSIPPQPVPASSQDCAQCINDTGYFNNSLFVEDLTPGDLFDGYPIYGLVVDGDLRVFYDAHIYGDLVVDNNLEVENYISGNGIFADFLSYSRNYIVAGTGLSLGTNSEISVPEQEEKQIYIKDEYGTDYPITVFLNFVDNNSIANGNVNGEAFSLGAGNSMTLSDGTIMECTLVLVGDSTRPGIARFNFPIASFESCSKLYTDSGGRVLCGDDNETQYTAGWIQCDQNGNVISNNNPSNIAVKHCIPTSLSAECLEGGVISGGCQCDPPATPYELANTRTTWDTTPAFEEWTCACTEPTWKTIYIQCAK